MKEKIFINARIIDPSQKMDEKGSVILDKNGKIKNIGKDIKKTDVNSSVEIIDVKGNILSKLICLIYILDYSSIYLSVKLNRDPTPVNSINYIKNKLQEKNN